MTHCWYNSLERACSERRSPTVFPCWEVPRRVPINSAPPVCLNSELLEKHNKGCNRWRALTAEAKSGERGVCAAGRRPSGDRAPEPACPAVPGALDRVDGKEGGFPPPTSPGTEVPRLGRRRVLPGVEPAPPGSESGVYPRTPGWSAE